MFFANAFVLFFSMIESNDLIFAGSSEPDDCGCFEPVLTATAGISGFRKRGRQRRNEAGTNLKSKTARNPGPGQGDLISVFLL